MQTHQVPLDGNCLFSALAIHLNSQPMILKLHFCLLAIKQLEDFVFKMSITFLSIVAYMYYLLIVLRDDSK